MGEDIVKNIEDYLWEGNPECLCRTYEELGLSRWASEVVVGDQPLIEEDGMEIQAVVGRSVLANRTKLD